MDVIICDDPPLEARKPFYWSPPPMKPHILIRYGIWLCDDCHEIGIGRTPFQAYEDWKKDQ